MLKATSFPERRIFRSCQNMISCNIDILQANDNTLAIDSD